MNHFRRSINYGQWEGRAYQGKAMIYRNKKWNLTMVNLWRHLRRCLIRKKKVYISLGRLLMSKKDLQGLCLRWEQLEWRERKISRGKSTGTQSWLHLKDERIQSPCSTTKRKGGNMKNKRPKVYSLGGSEAVFSCRYFSYLVKSQLTCFFLQQVDGQKYSGKYVDSCSGRTWS